MAEMVLTCPYCASDLVTFAFGGERPINREPDAWNTLWVCRRCEEGVVVTLVGPGLGSPGRSVGDPRDEGFFVHAIHPDPQQTRAPDHVPEDIARDFEEALDNLRRQNWTSAGMMFRKVLQRATSRLAPEGINFRAMKLVQRIENLDKERLITPAMKEWAHKIRLDGNEATHEEDEGFSDDQAKLMREFAELFLIYSFTLPARIAASNRATESED